MKSNTIKIYIEFIDGTNVFIPVYANELATNNFQIQNSEEFDYEDDSILFEFGVNDIVTLEDIVFSNGTHEKKASSLVKRVDNRNIIKSSLFRILKNNILIKNIHDEFSPIEISNLIQYSNTCPYPHIKSILSELKNGRRPTTAST